MLINKIKKMSNQKYTLILECKYIYYNYYYSNKCSTWECKGEKNRKSKL